MRSLFGALACVVLAAGLGCGSGGAIEVTSSALTQFPQWEQRNIVSPTEGRAGATMVFDSLRHKVVMFGGSNQNTGQFTNETWEYDGVSWQERGVGGPSGRRYHAMVYDSDRNVSVMFGGRFVSNNPANDTWEWNGTVWSQVSTSGPAPRDYTAMAYDSDRHVVVLFGGAGGGVPWNDTWEFNGTWSPSTIVGSSPPVRYAARMIYDPVRRKTVLFGGNDTLGNLNDTWEYDGALRTWTLRNFASRPNPRNNPAFAFDSLRGRAVLFGGTNIVYYNDTWEYDGTQWFPIPAQLLVPNNNDVQMAFDADRARMVFATPVFSMGSWGTQTWEYVGLGGACGASCPTGFCVDNVCCYQASCGACQTCDGATPGYCTPLANTIDPDSCPYSCGPQGQCGKANGATCASAGECLSFSCVDGYCCDVACAGACQACNGQARGWMGASNGTCANAPSGTVTTECSPYACAGGSTCPGTCAVDNDCPTTHFCDAASHCVPRKTVGTACDEVSDCNNPGCRLCASGQCSDGVCCQSACQGPCRSCAIAGHVGECFPIAEGGVDLHGQCTITSPATCGTDGMCDGHGGCRLYPLGTECAATSCAVDGLSQNNARTCDGQGTCSAASTSSCGAYQCLSNACATSCGGSSDCSGSNICTVGMCVGGAGCATACAIDANCCPGEFCVNGSCAPSAADGHPCTSGTQCSSGSCVAGICCDSACSDGCFACDLPDAVGKCTRTGSSLCGGCSVACATNADCCVGDRCIAGGCASGNAPAIVSSPPSNAFVDEPYLYTLSASGSAPITYSVSPGGQGATIHPTSALLRWTPATVGASSLWVTATNPWGQDTQVLSVAVAPARPPAIVEDANPLGTVGAPYIYNAGSIVRAAGAQSSLHFSRIAGPADFLVSSTGAVSWTPSTAGTFTVTVQAVNDFGADVYTFNIAATGGTAIAPAPVAVASTRDNRTRGTAPLLARFDGSLSTGAITSYEWIFGDGSPPSAEASPDHSYFAPGGYVARLRVVDGAGRSSVDVLGISASQTDGGPYPPIVRILTDKNEGDASLAVHLSCDCSLAQGAKLQWFFGDGDASADPYPTHIFRSAGSYEVTLYGFDADTGMIGVDRLTVAVSDLGKFAPEVHAYADPPAANLPDDAMGASIQLTSRAVDRDGTIISTRWFLFDPSTQTVLRTIASTPDAVETFTEPGIYHAVFEATDNDGLIGSSQVDITISKNGAIPPEFLSVPSTVAKVDVPYEYSDSLVPLIRGTRPVSVQVGRPKGMTIDTRDGRVTWTPTRDQAGEQSAALVATNAAGSRSQNFAIIVEAPLATGGCSIGSSPTRDSGYLVTLGFFGLFAVSLRRKRRTALDARAVDAAR